jgi:diguanylate cyclase (GGDEF)-like protein/PAS domain S-box-containing protein
MFQLTSIATIVFFTTAINAVATVAVFKRVKTNTSLFFALGMLSLTWWTFFVGLGYAAVPLELKILFAKLDAAGYQSALLFMLLGALYFAGKETWAEDKRLQFIFAFSTIVNIALPATNELHQWVWTGFTPTKNNVVIFEHGPGFLWIALTGYTAIGFIVAILFYMARRGSVIHKRQARFLLLAGLVTITLNLLYLYGIRGMEGVDWSSVAFSTVTLIFLLAMQREHFIELAPIARDRLFNSLEDCMIVLDANDRIIDLNPAAEALFNVQVGDLIGKKLSDIQLLNGDFPSAKAGQSISTEITYGVNPKFYLEARTSPLYDRSRGALAGSLLVLQNITERRQKELLLRQLNEAVEKNPASIAITSPQGDITYVNPQFSSLTGYTYDEVVGKNPNILKSGQMPDSIYRQMWQTIQSGQTWRGEFLNRKKDGSLYWEDAIITPVLDPNGKIVNYLTVKLDITERKQMEHALQISEERFRQLVTSAPDAVLGIDTQGYIVFINHAVTHLLGYKDNELLGQKIEILVPDPFRNKHIGHRNQYARNPHTGVMGRRRDFKARHKDGHDIPVEITLGQSSTQEGPLTIAFMRDMTEHKLAEQQLRNAYDELELKVRVIEDLQQTLREQAIRDPLTGLHNRRHYNDIIPREISRAEREKYPICFIMIDIDNFKHVNDRFGHSTGDLVLQRLADQLFESTRAEDIVCRFGGEEFLLVLPKIDTPTALTIAERLRSVFHATKLIEKGVAIENLSISCGISEYPKDGRSEEQVLILADKALYTAKHSGRNRVVVWSDLVKS